MKHMVRVDMKGAVRGEDFEVVSYDRHTGAFTPVPRDIDHAFLITDAEPDMTLALEVGLGVIRMSDGTELLYDITDNQKENAKTAMRINIYYQLTHPDEDRRQIDYILNQNGGEEIIKKLLPGDASGIIARLKEIYKVKKGQKQNISPFNKQW